jgi:hypothetical protein
LDDPNLIRIKRAADQRARQAQALKRTSHIMYPPPLPSGRERRAWFLPPRLRNAVYRFWYRLYHTLEHYHGIASFFEQLFGWAALLGATYFTTALVQPVAEWLMEQMGANAKETFDKVVKGTEIIVLVALGLLAISYNVVRRRRMKLGYRFKELLKQWDELDDGTAGGRAQVTEWLIDELSKRTRRRTAFGPMIQSNTSPRAASRIRSQVAGYAAEVYSDQVSGIVDKEWENWEYTHPLAWVEDFPDGLMAATYETCRDRTFFSFVVPIRTPPGRLTRLDLRNLSPDEEIWRLLSPDHVETRPRRDIGRQPPTLMLVRLLMSSRPVGSPRGSPIEAQLGLILTGLLHLALLLGRLAADGDIANGLPTDTVILVIAANQQSGVLLERFGFELLQRSPPENAFDPHQGPGEANLRVYRFVVRPQSERLPAHQRFLDILTNLLSCFQESRPLAPASPGP